MIALVESAVKLAAALFVLGVLLVVLRFQYLEQRARAEARAARRPAGLRPVFSREERRAMVAAVVVASAILVVRAVGA